MHTLVLAAYITKLPHCCFFLLYVPLAACKVSQDNEFNSGSVQITFTFTGFAGQTWISEGSRMYIYGFHYASSCFVIKPAPNNPAGLQMGTDGVSFYQPPWVQAQTCFNTSPWKGWMMTAFTSPASAFQGGDLVLTMFAPVTANVKTLPNVTIVDLSGNAYFSMMCSGDTTKGSEGFGIFSGPQG